MTFPPSYGEATRSSWIHVVGPYLLSLVGHRDLCNLCSVNREFLAVFQPLLWTRPLQTAGLVSGAEGDELLQWLKFVDSHLPRAVSSDTRALARVLDARDLARNPYQFLSISPTKIQRSFSEASHLFPRLTCVLLDHLPDVDPHTLFFEEPMGDSQDFPLRLLSLVNCATELRTCLLSAPRLRNLECLDISGTHGDLLQIFRPVGVPNLHVLKIRNREINNATLYTLMQLLNDQLWSLDLTGNKLNDQAIGYILALGFSRLEFRFSGNPEVEGRLVAYFDSGLSGPKMEESPESASFNHPDRYLADPPAYDTPSDDASESQPRRNDGVSPIRPDSMEALVQKFSTPVPQWTDISTAPTGLTHLHLSGNDFTSQGITDLLNHSRGHLQYLSCDSMVLHLLPESHAGIWPRTVKLRGMLGQAQVLRPCISANLRELHIHHSIVTQLPTFEIDGWSTLERLYFAEKSLLPRAEIGFPQAFLPDMNPRLTTLSLMRIPYRSCGPLIKKLIHFLKLLAIQERDIRERHGSAPLLRGPGILKGLRHLTLEFEPDPLDEHSLTSEDFDAEAILNSGDPGFSFFADEQARPPAEVSLPIRPAKRAESATNGAGSENDPLADWELLNVQDSRNGGAHVERVWIGTQKPHANPMINDYRRLVVKHNMRFNVQSASPTQVAAGVPADAKVYQTAWFAAIMPPVVSKPGPEELKGMVKVLDHLKQHRESGKAEYVRKGFKIAKNDEHLFWTGDLWVAQRR